ncbi:hypothetical protein HOY82DRAFT_132734 [Tuber indicum]|nr:hypothetical protein HOY82DRAFT_132734 [Tuber indicum]
MPRFLVFSFFPSSFPFLPPLTFPLAPVPSPDPPKHVFVCQWCSTSRTTPSEGGKNGGDAKKNLVEKEKTRKEAAPPRHPAQQHTLSHNGANIFSCTSRTSPPHTHMRPRSGSSGRPWTIPPCHAVRLKCMGVVGFLACNVFFCFF